MSTNTTKKMQVFGLKCKSAYEYAQEGGYIGTEEEFRAKLAKEYYTYDELHDKPFEEIINYELVFENVEMTSMTQTVVGLNTELSYDVFKFPMKVIYNQTEYIITQPLDGQDVCGDSNLVGYPFSIKYYSGVKWYIETANVSDIITMYVATSEINPIDEKFIPDTIARIPDWTVYDPYSSKRIDNKPFGKVTEYVLIGEDYEIPEVNTEYKLGSTWVNLIAPYKVECGKTTYTFSELPLGDENLIEYPFYVRRYYDSYGGYMYYVTGANAGDNISVYGSQVINKQLDEAYIPDTIARTADIPTIPTQLSAFENDSEFITNTVDNLTNYYLKSETYTQDEVKALVSAIPKFSIQVVDILPTEDISTTTVYLVKSGEETDNLYTEYIYVNGAWEYLGKQTVDLSGYALAADVLKKDNTEEYTPTEDYHPATKKYVDESINELSEEMEEFDNTVSELKDTKLSLPTDSEGNVVTGTAGQVLVSDGNGGFTWTTISTETAEDGNEVTY